MKHPLHPHPACLSIPLLVTPVDDPHNLYSIPRSSQPILQFKELEVDHQRYAAWRAACARDAAVLARVRALDAFFRAR